MGLQPDYFLIVTTLVLATVIILLMVFSKDREMYAPANAPTKSPVTANKSSATSKCNELLYDFAMDLPNPSYNVSMPSGYLSYPNSACANENYTIKSLSGNSVSITNHKTTNTKIYSPHSNILTSPMP